MSGLLHSSFPVNCETVTHATALTKTNHHTQQEYSFSVELQDNTALCKSLYCPSVLLFKGTIHKIKHI